MNNEGFIKGIGIGLVTGGIVGVVATSGRRRMKKCKNRTIKAIGDVVDNVTDMLGK